MKNWKKLVFGELSWKQLFKSTATIYGVLLLFAVFLGDYLLFVPPTPTYTASSANITLIDSAEPEEKIATFYLPAKEGMPTLLWSHGNAEDLSNTFFLELFHEAGFGVLGYDYPGYGISDGKPSESACYQAIDKAYAHLTETLAISPEKIIIVGQSVGSGPSCYLAANKPAKALVLITPLTSAYRVGFGYPIFPCDRFPNLSRIKGINLPLMVIHGDQDEVVPQKHGIALIEAHKGTNIFHDLKGRGHNDISGRTTEEIEDLHKLFVEFNESIQDK